MKKLLILSILISFVVCGCGSEEKVKVICDIENGTVFVDGEKHGDIRIGYKSLTLPAGDYSFLVKKTSSDGSWIFSGQKKFTIESGKTNYVELLVEKNETPQRVERIKKEIALLKQRGVEFIINDGGTVTDPSTGLEWMRCALGQKWDGLTCVDDKEHPGDKSVLELLNKEASRKGENEWRLPTCRELKSIVYCSSGTPNYKNASGDSCSGEFNSPTIAQAFFPNTPKVDFWTSTIKQVFFRREADFVNFAKGYRTSTSNPNSKSRNRLVRNLTDEKFTELKKERPPQMQKKVKSEPKKQEIVTNGLSPAELYDKGMRLYYGAGLKKDRDKAVVFLVAAAKAGSIESIGFLNSKKIKF